MRRGKFKLIDTPLDLINSILEFNSKSEYIKNILGSNPKYFAYINVNGVMKFGMAKFCAFKNITSEAYLKETRYATSGGNTQEHISRITNIKWEPLESFDNEVSSQFSTWIAEYFPDYRTHKFHLLEVEVLQIIDRPIIKELTPEQLLTKLQQQKEIGQIAEFIALKYEQNRLSQLGCKNVINCIEHVSLYHVSAGYDIFSSYKKQTRYIEVKGTTQEKTEFYISRNELQTLEYFEDEAYLYLVMIENINLRKGAVLIFQNPIRKIKEQGTLEPQIFKVTMP